MVPTHRSTIFLRTDSTRSFYFAVQQLRASGVSQVFRPRLRTKERPLSLTKNIEFLRNMPKLPISNPWRGFGQGMPAGIPSPLVETLAFGSNPGDLRMFSFVPEDLRPH